MKAWLIVDGTPQALKQFTQARILDKFPRTGNSDRVIGLLQGDTTTIHPEEVLGDRDVQGFGVYREEQAARNACKVLADT